jgi:hypothetical protein
MNEKPDLEALIWSRLDGTLTPEEEDRLESWLTGNTEARTLEESVVGLSRQLEQVRDLPPPDELKGRILRAVAERRVAASAPSPWLDGLRRALGREWRVRYAYLAAGLVVGVIGYHLATGLGRPAPADDSAFYGAMRPAVSAPAGSPLALELAASRGSLDLGRHDHLLLLDLQLAPGPAVTVTLAGSGFELRSLEAEGTEPCRLKAAPGLVTLEPGEAGRFRVAVKVADSSSFLELSVLADHQTLLHRALHFSDLPQLPSPSTNFSAPGR